MIFIKVVSSILNGVSTSDLQEKKVSSHTRAQDYQMDDPCYDIGGGVPPIGIKVKDPMCGISRAIQMVSFQHIYVVPIKMKIQVSTIYPNASLCINGTHTFYRN